MMKKRSEKLKKHIWKVKQQLLATAKEMEILTAEGKLKCAFCEKEREFEVEDATRRNDVMLPVEAWRPAWSDIEIIGVVGDGKWICPDCFDESECDRTDTEFVELK